MSIQTIELFMFALCVQAPWECARIDFDPTMQMLDLHVDFKRWSLFFLPNRGTAGCPLHCRHEREPMAPF
jgi:hypothetical protein